jgi:plasmid stabilization system protein ParE
MILLSPDAVDDIERLRSFLDQKNPDAARRALALIWSAIDRLQEFPDLGMPTADADIRPNRDPVWCFRVYRSVRLAARGRKHPDYANLAWPRGADLTPRLRASATALRLRAR